MLEKDVRAWVNNWKLICRPQHCLHNTLGHFLLIGHLGAAVLTAREPDCPGDWEFVTNKIKWSGVLTQ
jgi:hypothetical protein